METTFATKIPSGVQCLLCPHACKLLENEWGKCKARQNMNNQVIAKNYGRVAAFAIDPIEKKPLFHFYPGQSILSIGTFGCNFKCAFCQNWQLAHGDEKGEFLLPEKLAEIAEELESRGNIGVAYTYSEPLMWYEYVRDTAIKVEKRGLKNVLVSNGFINSKPLKELLPFISGANIDIKSFNNEFYKQVVGGELSVVLKNLTELKNAGVHIEITFLIVTSLNDSYQETKAMVKWIKEEIGVDTPLHLSRYFPNYKLDLPATSQDKMLQCYETAKVELPYVYLGNIEVNTGKNTICTKCGSTLVQRQGFLVNKIALIEGKCENCGQILPGRF